jgi:competence protein ComEC
VKHLDFRKFPAVFTFLPLAAGIILSYNLDLGISYLAAAYFYYGLIILTAIIIISCTFVKLLLSLQYAVYCLLLILFGSLSMQYYYYKVEDNNISGNTQRFKYSSVVVYGTITDDPDIREDRIRTIVEIDSLTQGFNSYYFTGTLNASVYRNKFSNGKADSLIIGDKVQLIGKLEPLPHTRNPGEFDYGEYLKLHSIDAAFSANGFEYLKKTGNGDAGFFKTKVITPVKAYINNVINTYSNGDEREFLRGLLLGDKSNISKETKGNFVNAGVAHIIAVSGLNVAYVLIIINGLLLILPIPKTAKNIILIFSLLFYMELTGNSPSIVRATVMAIVFLLAQMFERKPNSYNTLAFSALVILVADPRQLFDSGFILSFSAILSLIYFDPKLENLVMKVKWYATLDRERKLNKFFIGAVTIFLGTLAAQLGTLPVTAVMFKKVSVVSFAVNIFAIPLSNISLALGFVSVFTSLISSLAAGIFAYANTFLMFYLLKAIAVCANFDFSYVETYRMDVLFTVVFYSVVLLLFSVTKRNYRSRLVIVILLICDFMIFKSILSVNNNAKITYLDVGNSNCSLIEMPGGTNMLINAGTSTLNYTSAERNVIPYLKREGIGSIDLLMITAMDANEYRNLKYLAGHFVIKKIIVPEYYREIFTNASISKDLKNQAIEFVDSSRILNSKGKFRIYLYYDKQLRNASIMAKFVYGGESFIFTDNEEAVDISYNDRLIVDSSRLAAIRVPQYGSFEYTPAEFLIRSNPSSIIISQKNRSKIAESDAFEETLYKSGFKIFNVSDRGAVILETDGKRTKVVNWK